MSSNRRKSPSVNENWTKTEVLTLIKKNATEALNDCKKEESKHKVVYVRHPTIRNTFVRHYLD